MKRFGILAVALVVAFAAAAGITRIISPTHQSQTSSVSGLAIDIKPSLSFSAGKVKAGARITNLGTESAKLVQLEAILGSSSARSDAKESLATNEPYHVSVDLGNAPTPPGVHTVVLKVHYEDANGYPFSAVSSIPLTTVDPDLVANAIKAQLSSVRISETMSAASAVMTLHTTNATPIDAGVSLVLPDEFETPNPTANVTVSSGAPGSTIFSIRNKSARKGSGYPVFALVDYEENGQHRSVVAHGSITVSLPSGPLAFMNKRTWIFIISLIFALFVLIQFIQIPEFPGMRILASLFPYAALAAILAFTLWHVPLPLLLADTLTVGGDTVAHNYLASHFKEQLFNHGRIISWAGGWWCGFPMFQFYFCLPYALISLLSFAMPFNIAFKIVTMLGVLILPGCAYLAARIMRLPKPGPILLAIAMIPFLFDNSNTMWGVNVYSTLAGMISNSISFSIMIVFIACAARDADDGQFRLSTVFLLVLLLASHFFTTLIACLTIAILPLLRPRAGFAGSVLVLAKECGLAFILMSWWLVPLVAKRAYSMDFGTNWDLSIRDSLPTFALYLAPAAVIALPLALWLRIRFVAAMLWMLVCSVFLLYFGYDRISPVFVNVRLWPFAIYALLAISAAGIALLVKKLKATELAAAALLILALVFGPGAPNFARSWAEWNYEGLENKPRWPVFRDLILPLDKTPGRLANDLCDRNCSFGSSRIFECVPHVIEKPILEGGIVNSAAGSMFSYYIQGETSDHCAGFPPIVTPTNFNFAVATKHLELFNVKHFIAASSQTKAALAQSKDWRFLRESQGWQLYELTTHNGGYVFIPKNQPVPFRTNNWKQAGLDWIYANQLIDRPYVPLVLLSPSEKTPELPTSAPCSIQASAEDEAGSTPVDRVRGRDQRCATPRTFVASNTMTVSRDEKPPDEDIRRYNSSTNTCRVQSGTFTLANSSREHVNFQQDNPIPVNNYRIWDEKISDDSIRFRTTGIGLPHIIKCTYYPNWKVRGAAKVYMVTPCFMLVYPQQEEVELYYGSIISDNAGRFLSVLGLGLTIAIVFRRRRTAVI